MNIIHTIERGGNNYASTEDGKVIMDPDGDHEAVVGSMMYPHDKGSLEVAVENHIHEIENELRYL